MPVGSNAKRISEITEAFSKIDPNDKRTYDAPVDRFQEMSVMWGPAESLLAAVNKSGEDLDAAAEKYQAEAETAIADMQ